MSQSIIASLPALFDGLLVTVWLSVIVIVGSLGLGVTLGMAITYGNKPVVWSVRIFSDVIRGIPILVFIFFVFYALPIIGLNFPSFLSAVIALTLFKAAQTVEVARGALQSIHKGQMEASKSIGLTFLQSMRYVILPQAVRRFLPPWINGVVDAVKGSALVSLVGVVDLMATVQETVGRTFQPLPIYVIGALIYFAINFSLSTMSRRLEARFTYIRE